MKKLIALMLIVCCILSFAACANKEEDVTPTPDNDPIITPDEKPDAPKFSEEEIAAVKAIQAKIDASAPETATIAVALATELGTLNGNYYVFYNRDGSAIVNYSYEKFNTFTGDLFDDMKTTFSGTCAIAVDGTVFDAPNDITSVQAITIDLNLDHTKFETAEVSSSLVNATIKAENTEAVLGVAIDADVKIVINVGSVGVVSVAISYTTEAGRVDIGTYYTYYVAPEVDEEVTE